MACVFTPLFVGGRLVIPRPGGQSSADYIMGLVAEHGVSFLPSVPTFGWEHFKTRWVGVLCVCVWLGVLSGCRVLCVFSVCCGRVEVEGGSCDYIG